MFKDQSPKCKQKVSEPTLCACNNDMSIKADKLVAQGFGLLGMRVDESY